MSSPQTQTTSDLQAVADALRSHDRFLLVTHENPDGDALGSLIAMHGVLGALGKDWCDTKEGEASIFRSANGSYALLARVQMDEWPRLAAAK